MPDASNTTDVCLELLPLDIERVASHYPERVVEKYRKLVQLDRRQCTHGANVCRKGRTRQCSDWRDRTSRRDRQQTRKARTYPSNSFDYLREACSIVTSHLHSRMKCMTIMAMDSFVVEARIQCSKLRSKWIDCSSKPMGCEGSRMDKGSDMVMEQGMMPNF